ncbi:hypothetical protein A9Q74_05685 [Colwellia sp. 39_35_sub15_T18]|nr:hypothetical protein A9Q74_05685 [Colwellia sp. 39_35_sub15_T18]
MKCFSLKWFFVGVIGLPLLIVFYIFLLSDDLSVDGQINAKVHRAFCNPIWPIEVEISNNTFQTIKRVTFDLELFKDNISVNKIVNISKVFSRQLEPFHSSRLCFSDTYIQKAFGVYGISDSYLKKNKEITSQKIVDSGLFSTFANTHEVFVANVQVEYLPD